MDAIERVSARDAQEHPFGSGRTIVMPRPHDVIDRRNRDRIVLGLPLVAAGRIDGRLALSGSGGQLAEIPVSFEPADRDEIIRLIELPVGSLPPGTYEIRLTISAGSRTFVRRTAAVLVDSANP